MDFLNLPSTDRPIVAHTALGPQLGFLSLKGREGLSKLFEFEVELVSGTYLLDVRSMLSTDLTIEIETSSGAPRYLSGKVTEFALLGRELANSPYYLYKATVRPAMWYLTQGQDSRIFQNQNVESILKEVLGRYGFPVEYQLNESYRDWEYCVQYQESDFNFVSRLMEHEGMYYYFKHDDGQHTLVITDDAASHEAFPGYGSFTYFDSQSNVDSDNESVDAWHHRAGMTPAKYAVIDYDFRKPQVKLDALTSESLAGDEPSLEMYEWQGGYQEIDHGDQYARIRMQELKVNQEIINGQTTVRGAAPGYVFTLQNHPRSAENKEYLIIEAVYQMGVAGYATGTERQDHFEIFFDAIPSEVQFRAPRITRQPKTSGPQTARVVGPAGQELYTDKYGRIKAQFHWDREGKYDENSSCWIRVSSPWAGGGFGGLQLPRIGDEVVVDFIGGNPDRPIILGRVYNEMNMPPVNLPAEANVSGFRTQSEFGDASTENFLLFTDKLGQELIDLRAQYNMIVNVLNDLTITVGNDRHETIKNNLTTLVTSGNEVREVQSGTRTTLVQGLEKSTFNTGRETTISAGDTFTVTDAGQTVSVTDGRKTTITGTDEETVSEMVTNNYNNGITETVSAALASYKNKVGFKHEVTGENWDTEVGAGHAKLTAQDQVELKSTASTGLFESNGRMKIESKTSLLQMFSESSFSLRSSSGPGFIRSKGNLWVSSTSGEITMRSPTKITVNTPVFEHVGAKQEEEHSLWQQIVGNNFSMKIFSSSITNFKLDFTSVAISGYSFKTDIGQLKVDISMLSMKNQGLSSEMKGAKFNILGLKLEV